MNAQELAQRFNAKVAAAATEQHHQEDVAAESSHIRLEDLPHIKRAMVNHVIRS